MDLKLSRSKGGIGDLKLSRSIGGVDDLKLSRKGGTDSCYVQILVCNFFDKNVG